MTRTLICAIDIKKVTCPLNEMKKGPKKIILDSHYSDVIMGEMASQITSLMIVYATVYRSKKASKFCITGLCEGKSPVTGEFPVQRARNAGNVSI